MVKIFETLDNARGNQHSPIGWRKESPEQPKAKSSRQPAQRHSKSKKETRANPLYNVSNITSKPKSNTRDSRRAAQRQPRAQPAQSQESLEQPPAASRLDHSSGIQIASSYLHSQ